MYASELFRKLIMNELRKFEGSNESPSAAVFVNIFINSVITKWSRKKHRELSLRIDPIDPMKVKQLTIVTDISVSF